MSLNKFLLAVETRDLSQAAHCKYLNAWFECNDIVISVYSHYHLDPNAKSSETLVTLVTFETHLVSDDFAFGSRG
jgi:hypothetical protein